jgi:hypothetical protein
MPGPTGSPQADHHHKYSAQGAGALARVLYPDETRVVWSREYGDRMSTNAVLDILLGSYPT